MAIQPIGPYGQLPQLGQVSATAPSASQASSSFSDVVNLFLQDVNSQQLQAEGAVERLATGQTDNVHEVMMALSQADLSFRMAMEVRDQVIEAYREVIRMQV